MSNISLGDATRQDLEYAFRRLRHAPGFAAVAVLTLALGIGATTAIFTVVDAVLLRPLPYADADHLVRLVENVPAAENRNGRPRRRTTFTRAELRELRERAHALSHVAGQSFALMTLTGHDEAMRVQAAAVSPDLFPKRGVQRRRHGAARGRHDLSPALLRGSARHLR